MVFVLITCSLLAGPVNAGQFDQLCPVLTGCCIDPCCEQNQSVCLFGGTCNERVTTISLGMTGSRFSGTPTSGPAPLEVQFSANAGPEIATWSWDFGDGSFGSGMNPVHVYTTPGIYTVKLTVRKSQTSVNYQVPSMISWGQENTWQKDAMIQVTGAVITSEQGSSDQKEAPSSLTGITTPGSTDMTGQLFESRPAMYTPVNFWKVQQTISERGKLNQRASVLTSWKQGFV